MNKQVQISQRRALVRKRVRAKISGTAKRPRLSVSISLLNVRAQLIDDTTGTTLAQASTVGQKAMSAKNLTEKAEWTAEEISKIAKTKKISTVVFDRGIHQYHGRVKAFATKARAGGLKF